MQLLNSTVAKNADIIQIADCRNAGYVYDLAREYIVWYNNTRCRNKTIQIDRLKILKHTKQIRIMLA